MEVTRAVGADDHGYLLLIEGVDHALQGVGGGIEVVGVELHGKAPAALIVDGEVPAAADAQVGALWNEVHQPAVFTGHLVEEGRGCVGAVVVHHNNVELKARLLHEGRGDGLTDGLLAVVDRDDHRRLAVEVLLGKVGCPVTVRIYEGAHETQVAAYDTLHLLLGLAVTGIYIVKLPLPVPRRVFGFVLCIERLVEVQQLSMSAEKEPQVVPASAPQLRPALSVPFLSPGFQKLGAQQHQGAEVEVVAQAALLIVGQGVPGSGPSLLGEEVGIDHGGSRHRGGGRQPLHGIRSQGEGGWADAEQGIGSLGAFGHGAKGLRRQQSADAHRDGSLYPFLAARGAEQPDAPDGVLTPELRHEATGRGLSAISQEAISIFSHFSVFLIGKFRPPSGRPFFLTRRSRAASRRPDRGGTARPSPASPLQRYSNRAEKQNNPQKS